MHATRIGKREFKDAILVYVLNGRDIDPPTAVRHKIADNLVALDQGEAVPSKSVAGLTIFVEDQRLFLSRGGKGTACNAGGLESFFANVRLDHFSHRRQCVA